MMEEPEKKVIVVPCSGIGKPYGSVSREAAYILTEDERPGDTRLIALSRLVLGDEDARAAVSGSAVIAIDGCKLACASVMVKECGAAAVTEYAVLDAHRRNRDLKPQGIAELNEAGLHLAAVISSELAAVVDAVREGEYSREEEHA